MNPVNFAAVICAAGNSSRMGGVKKEYCLLPGTDTAVLARVVMAFAAFPDIRRIIIAVPENAETGEAAARRALPPELAALERPRICFTAGGGTRRESVHNALRALAECKPGEDPADIPDYVLIHDGSRPWVSARLIQRVMDAVQRCQAVIPLLPLVDTPKEINFPFDAPEMPDAARNSAAGSDAPGQTALPVVTRHIRRSLIGLAQTPQAFEFSGIAAAHGKAALRENTGLYEYTDDAQVWADFCGPVSTVPGEAENRKITFPDDLEV